MIRSDHMLRALAEVEEYGSDVPGAARALDVDVVALISATNLKAQETLNEEPLMIGIAREAGLTEHQHKLAMLSSESAISFLWGVRAARLAPR